MARCTRLMCSTSWYPKLAAFTSWIGFHRFRSLVRITSSAGVLCHSWQIQSALRRVYSRAVDKSTGLRCDQAIILTAPRASKDYPQHLAPHQVLRCRTRQESGISNQQFRFACADYHRALSLSLAGRTILQMDQTASSVLSGSTAPPRMQSKTQIWIAITVYVLVAIVKKRDQYRRFALHNSTDFEPDSFSRKQHSINYLKIRRHKWLRNKTITNWIYSTKLPDATDIRYNADVHRQKCSVIHLHPKEQ